MGNVKIKAALAAVTMVEFRILRAQRRLRSKLTTLAFRRDVSGFFKDLLSNVPWDEALEKRGSKKAS